MSLATVYRHFATLEDHVSEAFAFYERAGRIVDNVRRDREKLAVLQRAWGVRARPAGADEAAQAASRSLLAVLPRGRPRTSG